MPKFFIDDVDIEVSEFLYNCNRNEKLELMRLLIEDNIIDDSGNEKKIGLFEKDFSDKLDSLKECYYRISKEDEDIINSIVKRYT